ncbi:ABC transporter permease [Blastopirellula marina]|uniref:ABC transporter permease n=1 Tax=Blastopirellula marina TaxID=124 RepID=A0A2S8GE99_9BACT|nr:ABC transporter permease [Blastopirellula marina]PQO42769.1 hypothetical protein C5Y98_01035 [Blastopirellula marina]PTL46535.1 hypothetical protein C5Y97_01035 [Blastopirellula marina]
MRPYLTVICDSFHEAFASRVLYILLLVLTIVLLGVAPLGYQEKRSTQYHRMSVRDIPAFLEELRKQDAGDQPSPGKHLVAIANPTLQKLVRGDQAEGDAPSRLSERQVNDFVNGLNDLLRKKTLYQEQAWKNITLSKQEQELLEQGPENLSQDQLIELNRFLFHRAFPAQLGAVPNEELYLKYAFFQFEEPLSISKDLLPIGVNLMLFWVIDIIVGMLAIFVAILVTAPIIPRTFEPGAIDLLLSKPVSRSLLILAKYFGGCVFILLTVTYFLVGLWFIVGWRFGVWSQPLLLCIPIFMFQFAIYFAVSTFAGVVWRNSIVSIVVTVLFFLACFTVGTTKLFMEETVINPTRLVRLVPTEEALLGVTQNGQFVQWNESQHAWDNVLFRERRRGPASIVMQSVLVGPIYHAPTQSLMYLEQPTRRGGIQRLGVSGGQFKTAQWNGNWVPSSVPNPPTGASWILQDSDENILVVGSTGVHLYQAGTEQKKANFLGFDIPLGSNNAFTRLGPNAGVPYLPPFAAAIDRTSNDILVANQGLLYRLHRAEDGKYVVQQEINREEQGAVIVGLTPKYAVVVTGKGVIELRDAQSLELKGSLHPAGNASPTAVETSPDGQQVAVLFHSGDLWLYDIGAGEGRWIDSDASAVAFDGDRMLVADAKTHVRVESLETGQITQTYTPVSDTWRLAYDWIVEPIHFVFPKPGELNKLTNHLLTDVSGPTTIAGLRSSGDLREVQSTDDVLQPVIHNAIFIAVMLAITCFYVSRLDL